MWLTRTRARVDVTRDPRRLRRAAEKCRARPDRGAVASFDDETSSRSYVGEEEITADDLPGAPRRHLASEIMPVLCGSASRTRACSRCSTPSSSTCPARSTSPPSPAMTLQGQTEEIERPPDDKEPFVGAGVQDRDDPHVGQLTYVRVYSGTLKKGDTSSTPNRTRSGSAASSACTPTTARTSTRPAPATSSPRRPQGHPHRRHALRPRPAIVLEQLEFPEPVIHAVDRARPARPTRTSWPRPCSPLRGRPDLPGAHRRGDRPDDHLGMGELHLEISSSASSANTRSRPTVGKPQVAYRETITRTVTSTSTST